MMLRHLDVSALRLNYIDTGMILSFSPIIIIIFFLDSMVMCLSKPLDEMVLPGKERSWEHHKKKWFVQDESQLRTPGLLKSEFSIKSGTAVFLSPKCYLMHSGEDDNPDGVKRALKGINDETNITREEFLNSLYQNEVVKKRQIRLKRDLKKLKFSTVAETKKALNSVYYKMKVSDDFLSCSPHM